MCEVLQSNFVYFVQNFGGGGKGKTNYLRFNIKEGFFDLVVSYQGRVCPAVYQLQSMYIFNSCVIISGYCDF